jgi:ABC-type molybdenum transport system ATPase subunit/photorepair protein PhrA
MVVELYPPLTTFVGPCGSGKTSLLRAIQATCALLDALVTGNVAAIYNRFCKAGLLERGQAVYSFMLIQTDDGSRHCFGFQQKLREETVSFFSNMNVEPDVSITSITGFTGGDSELFVAGKSKMKLVSDSDESDDFSNIRKIVNDLQASLAVVPQDHGHRDITFNDYSWYLHETRLSESLLSSDAKALLCSLTNLVAATGTSEETDATFYKKQMLSSMLDPKVPLRQLSAGESDAVFCCAGLLGFTHKDQERVPKLIVLDEPGQNLGAHQRTRLRSAIEIFSKQPNVHVILITHHVEMLNPPTLPLGVVRFSNDIRSYKRQQQQAVSAKPYKITSSNDMKMYYQRLDHMELYFANGVILVEGRNDVEALYALNLWFQELNQKYSHPKTSADEKHVIETNLKLINCFNSRGISWKVVPTDGCDDIRKKAALCEEMNLDYVCIYDFDYLCQANKNRSTLYPRIGEGSISHDMSHMGGHVFNSFDKAGWRWNLPENAKEYDWTKKPRPPIVHFYTLVAFLYRTYIAHLGENSDKKEEEYDCLFTAINPNTRAKTGAASKPVPTSASSSKKPAASSSSETLAPASSSRMPTRSISTNTSSTNATPSTNANAPSTNALSAANASSTDTASTNTVTPSTSASPAASSTATASAEPSSSSTKAAPGILGDDGLDMFLNLIVKNWLNRPRDSSFIDNFSNDAELLKNFGSKEKTVSLALCSSFKAIPTCQSTHPTPSKPAINCEDTEHIWRLRARIIMNVVYQGIKNEHNFSPDCSISLLRGYFCLLALLFNDMKKSRNEDLLKTFREHGGKSVTAPVVVVSSHDGSRRATCSSSAAFTTKTLELITTLVSMVKPGEVATVLDEAGATIMPEIMRNHSTPAAQLAELQRLAAQHALEDVNDSSSTNATEKIATAAAGAHDGDSEEGDENKPAAAAASAPAAPVSKEKLIAHAKANVFRDLACAALHRFEAEAMMEALKYFVSSGCGHDDYIIWPPQVADIEGLFMDKNCIVTDDADQPDDSLKHACFLAWKHGERARLAKHLVDKKGLYEKMTVEQKLKHVQDVFAKDKRWDENCSQVIGVATLFRRLKLKHAV